MEIWKAIPGYPGYEASTHGRVRSVDRIVEFKNRRGTKAKCKKKGRVLSNNLINSGYLVVHLHKNGRRNRKVITVHKLVAELFIGPKPEGCEVLHKDGDKHNNHVSNLRYGTKSENGQDKVFHGSTNTPLPVVVAVKWQLRHKYPVGGLMELGAHFGISRAMVYSIKSGASYSHIKVWK